MTRNGGLGSPAAAFIGTSASSVATMLITFASGILVARVLGPVGRGEYGTALLIAQTVAAILSLSFFDGAIVELRKASENLHKVLPAMFTVALSMGVGASAFVILGLSQFPPQLTQTTQLQLKLFSVLIIIDLMLWQCFAAAERSQMSFFLVNLSRMVSPAAFSLLLILAYSGREDALSTALVLGLFLAAKIPMLIIWLWRYLRNILGAIEWQFIWKAGRIGLILHPAIVLGIVSSQLDRLIAIGAWPKDLLGLYFVAFSAVGAGYAVITNAVNTVLFPYLSGMQAKERQNRLALIIRVTILISLAAVVLGLCILPYAIPILYGSQYQDATPISIGLLFALAILPLRTVVLEAGRSLGKGWSSLEMGIVSVTVMLITFGFTGFDTPNQLILALGLSNLLSMLAGLRHLIRDRIIHLGAHLVPGKPDVLHIAELLSKRWTKKR